MILQETSNPQKKRQSGCRTVQTQRSFILVLLAVLTMTLAEENHDVDKQKIILVLKQNTTFSACRLTPYKVGFQRALVWHCWKVHSQSSNITVGLRDGVAIWGFVYCLHLARTTFFHLLSFIHQQTLTVGTEKKIKSNGRLNGWLSWCVLLVFA